MKNIELIFIIILLIHVSLFCNLFAQDTAVSNDTSPSQNIQQQSHLSSTDIIKYFPFLIASIFIFALIIIGQIIATHRTRRELTKTNRELNKANQDLVHLSRTDPLTGLSNRRDMVEIIKKEQQRFSRSANKFSIIMADIDDFKEINDIYGHDGGDFILKSLAQLMTSLIRKQDSVSRWGGEEFLFLLPETDLTGGKALAEKIRKNIAITPYVFSDKELPVTMTFGVALFNKPMRMDECIKQADEALYKGKMNGKNQVVLAPVEEKENVIGFNRKK